MSTLATTNIKHPSSASNNIVLDSLARVGIGTASPQSLLHLEADGTALRIVRGSSTGFLYNTGTASTSTTRLQGNDGPVELYTNAAQPIVFSSNATERMRITNDGAVLIGSSSSALNTSTDKVKFAVGGTTRGIWMSGTIPASTTYTVNLGSDQPSGFLVLTIASDQYAPSQPSAATNTQTQLYLVVPLRSGAAAGSKTLVSSIIRGAPHGTIVWTNEGTSFTIQNTSGSAPLWYEVQYRL